MSGLQELNLRETRERCADCTIRHRAVCTYCGPQELALLEQRLKQVETELERR